MFASVVGTVRLSGHRVDLELLAGVADLEGGDQTDQGYQLKMTVTMNSGSCKAARVNECQLGSYQRLQSP